MKLLQLKNLFFNKSLHKKPDILVDNSHILKHEPGKTLHIVYTVLFGLGITSALWQHGSPVFTILVLALLFPAMGLLFVPYRFADILLRRMLACGIFFGSCIWVTFRLSKGIPFDLALAEGMIIGSFSFLVNGTIKDCNYLFFISIFLLIYAGLIPRKLLLYLVPGTALTLAIISVYEREQTLSGAGKLLKAANFSTLRNMKRAWHLVVLQLLIALPVFVLVLSFIPMQETGSSGLFEVSFVTSRNSAMPPDLQKWLRQDRQTAKNPGGENLIPGTNPDSSGKEGLQLDIPDVEAELDGNGRGSPPGKDLLFTVSMPLKLYHLATLYDMYDGKKWQLSKTLANQPLNSRRGLPAKPFAVECNYTIQKWISLSLYAPYRPAGFSSADGANNTTQWFKFFRKLKTNSFSTRFAPGTSLPDLPFGYKVTSYLLIPYLPRLSSQTQPQKKEPEISRTFDDYLNIWTENEKVRLEKLRLAEEARQKRLAAAREKQRKIAEQREKQRKIAAEKARLKRLAAAKKLKGKGKKTSTKTVVKAVRKPIPKKAATKTVKKAVPKKTAVKRPPVKRPVYDPLWFERLPKSHYLKTPVNLSPRIAELGKSITKDCLLPYQKAIALRDYLRKNYTYKLYAAPTPAGKESVEYFLFELKEGHCEYFAAALAILARTQNLPARVAVGFSPGNYNALTRKTEVYEYHAHAWTQIFIEKIGWLTFDAVPPSEIPSQTTPIGIGQFRDPFGDEWKVMPPELTPQSLEFAKKLHEKEIAERKARQLERQKKQALQKSQGGKNKKVLKVHPKGKKTQKIKKIKSTRAGEYVRNTLAGCRESLQNFLNYLLLTSRGRILGGCLSATLALLIIFHRKLYRRMKKMFYRLKQKNLLRKLENDKSLSTDQKLLLLYRAVRLLLLTADIERKNNQELLAYAESAGDIFRKKYLKKHPDSLDYEEKSQIFSKAVYAIFSLYYALEYGHCTTNENQYKICRQFFSDLDVLTQEIS